MKKLVIVALVAVCLTACSWLQSLPKPDCASLFREACAFIPQGTVSAMCTSVTSTAYVTEFCQKNVDATLDKVFSAVLGLFQKRVPARILEAQQNFAAKTASQDGGVAQPDGGAAVQDGGVEVK